MIVIRADIVNAMLGLLEAARKKFDRILDRVLPGVARLTATGFNEKSFAAPDKLAGRLNPSGFVGTSSQS